MLTKKNFLEEKMVINILVLLCFASPSFAQYYEPCDLSDYKCVSNELSRNSACDRRTWGQVPNVVGFNDVHYEAPYFNISVVDQTLVVKNLDKCFVSAFFFNLDTNAAVLAIDCVDLVLTSHDQLVLHAEYAQDLYYYNRITQKYPSLSMTVNLQNANQIDLCDAFVYTYIDVLPTYTFIPDPQYTNKFVSNDTTLLEYQNVFILEQWLYIGQNLFKLFVNSVLCDFNSGCSTTTPFTVIDYND